MLRTAVFAALLPLNSAFQTGPAAALRLSARSAATNSARMSGVTKEASWKGEVIASSADIVTVEGNSYFPVEVTQ